MSVRLLTEHHLEFLSSKGGCTNSSESIHVKMPHFWKSHIAANMYLLEVDCSVMGNVVLTERNKYNVHLRSLSCQSRYSA